MQIPTLTTARTVLIPPSTDCEDMYQRFYTDAEASRAYGGPLSPSGAWDRLAKDLGSWHLQGFGVWVIQRREEGDLVGICGFWQGKGWPRELTWWLLPEGRGKGLAYEASLVAVNYAYQNFEWESVETYMKDDNVSARSLILRLNGIKIDRRIFPDGLERDIYHIPPPSANWP